MRAPGRETGHARAAARAMGPMFKAFGNAKHQAFSEAEIRSRPSYRLMRKAGLFLSEHGDAPQSRREEQMIGKFAEKIPRLAGPQRAFTTVPHPPPPGAPHCQPSLPRIPRRPTTRRKREHLASTRTTTRSARRRIVTRSTWRLMPLNVATSLLLKSRYAP